MDPWLPALTQLAVLAYAALGGVFLAFSDFVMRALGRSPGGAEAMQAINREVFRRAFMPLFLGMGAVSLVLAASGAALLPERRGALLLAAAAVYLLGGLGVTVLRNVPLNERLAAMDPGAAGAREFWHARYLPGWTSWNTVRTAACLAAASLTLAASP